MQWHALKPEGKAGQIMKREEGEKVRASERVSERCSKLRSTDAAVDDDDSQP